MPFAFGDEPLNRGESVGLQCMVNKGDIPVDILWTINSSPIVSGQNSFTVMKLNSRTSSLNIEYLDAIHRGVYKCVANNKAGSTDLAAKLEVNGSLLLVCSNYLYYNLSRISYQLKFH